MFEQFLKDPQALARQRNGPLAEERRRYLVHCAEQRMSRETLRGTASYTLAIAKALRLAERPSHTITRAEIEAAANEWVNRPRRAKELRLHSFTGHALRWLKFLGRLQGPAVQHPYADHIAQFTDYLLRERGHSPQTVELSRRTLHQFLGLVQAAQLRLKALTVAQVDQLLAKQVSDEGFARTTISRWASALRGFFMFAEKQGWCRLGLAAAIMAPRVYRREGLPVGPTWEDVKRLLAAAEGDRPVDVRDRAMLMLLAVYGLPR